jgi:hypothetical protein
MGASAMLIGATIAALGVGSRMMNVETAAMHRQAGASQQCAKKVGELFDIARLARRDGKSSDVMVRELTVMSERLDACLLTAPDHTAFLPL